MSLRGSNGRVVKYWGKEKRRGKYIIILNKKWKKKTYTVIYLLKVSNILQNVNSIRIARSRSLEFSYFRWIKLWLSNNPRPTSSWWICFDFLFPLWREASRWAFTPHRAMRTWGNRLCWMTDTCLPTLLTDTGCCSAREALFPLSLMWWNIPGSVVKSGLPRAPEGLPFPSLLCCCTGLDAYFNMLMQLSYLCLHVLLIYPFTHLSFPMTYDFEKSIFLPVKHTKASLHLFQGLFRKEIYFKVVSPEYEFLNKSVISRVQTERQQQRQ